MIEVKNLVKRYGNHAAVDDLSFTVETGKVVGFLGPNGAGKSTTMNMITGYIAPTEGTVLIDGVDMSEEPEKAKANIGYLPEIPPLYQDLRVREYLQFVAELKRVPKKDHNLTVYETMKKTKTVDVSERLIRHLSKGYKQRVGLAAAMIGAPDILILDEPTVGLDPSQIIEIRDLIRELSQTHTILLSSHIMQEISAVCDEIIIINEGKMIACDTPENLTQAMVQSNGTHLVIKGERDKIKEALRKIVNISSVKYDEENEEGTIGMTVYTDVDNDIREEIFYTMAECNCPILEMHQLATSLEDAFLALTKGGSRQFGGKKSTQKKKVEETLESSDETVDVEESVSEEIDAEEKSNAASAEHEKEEK